VQCACAKNANYFQFFSEFVAFLKLLLGRDFMKFVCQNLGHLVHEQWHCFRRVGRPVVKEGEIYEQNGCVSCGPSGTVETAGRTKTAVKNFKQDKSKQKWEEIKHKTGGNEGNFIIKGKVHKDGGGGRKKQVQGHRND